MKEHTIRQLIARRGEPPYKMRMVYDDGVIDFEVTREDLEVSPNGERAMARALERSYPDAKGVTFNVKPGIPDN